MDDDRNHAYGEAGVRYHLRDALGTAVGYHTIFNNSDIVVMANTHSVNVHGAVKTTATHAALEVTGLVMELYRNRFGKVPVGTAWRRPGGARQLHASAALSEDGRTLTVGLVNAGADAATVRLHVEGQKLRGAGAHWYISDPDDRAYNEPGEPPRVTTRQAPAREPSQPIPLKGYSVNLLRFPTR